MLIPKTLFDALSLFVESEEVNKNPKLLCNLKTALRKYVLPRYGLTNRHNFDSFITTLELKRLCDVQKQFQITLSELPEESINQGTVRNYRSALNRFQAWMKSQSWYHEALGTYDGKYAPRMKMGYHLHKHVKGRRQYSKQPYALKENEISPHVQQQLNDLHRFLTSPLVSKRKGEAIREITWRNYRQLILGFLGWLHRFECRSLNDLDLRIMVSDGTDMPRDTLDRFFEWAVNEKGNGYKWTLQVGTAALNIAKYFYGSKSKKHLFRDIEEVENIRAKLNEMQIMVKKEPYRSNFEEKLLTFEQLIHCLDYLRRCTAPRDSHKGTRSEMAVMKSWQKYLIISILTYCPVRQRELRELELGKTLFRVNNGYIVRLKPEDHKTGSKTGKGREYPLPELLTQDLEIWLNI